jgi:hypothetical protein
MRQVRIAEVGSVEVRPAKIRNLLGAFPSPLIPSLYAFLEFCQMSTHRRGASLSSAVIMPRRGGGGKCGTRSTFQC